MKLPFTVDQFLGIFSAYNQAIFPAQFFAYALGLACVYLIFRASKYSGRVIIAALSAFWLWMGAFYHLTFFTDINKAAYGFGVLFIFQGLIFLFISIFSNKIEIEYRKDLRGATGLVLIAYSMVIYPMIGYFSGHVYPAAPVFGLTPCPAVIFTFGVLLNSKNLLNYRILTIPLLWSVIGFSAAFTLGIFEDIGLLVSGMTAAGFAAADYRRSKAASTDLIIEKDQEVK